jgi:regulator of nonsense transcripts 3
VTEALLAAAFTPFGALTKVEMDKKKGFGYVDFVESESLQRAMLASPVTVAQSQVVVLERKANPGGERGEKGRKGRGESQQPKDKAKTVEGNVTTTGSSRGSRGGRGGRNKGKSEGPKGGGGAGGGEEKTGSSEAI